MRAKQSYRHSTVLPCARAELFLQDDANVKSALRKTPSFIRAVAGPVLKRGCRSTIKERGASREAQIADRDCLIHLCKLLAPFVEDNDTQQVEVLFEAQKLCEETGHIRGA